MVNSTLFHPIIDVPLSVPPKLTKILLQKALKNRLDFEIPRIINNDPILVVLDFPPTRFKHSTTTRLSEALMLNSTITSLDIAHCFLGDLGVTSLALKLLAGKKFLGGEQKNQRIIFNGAPMKLFFLLE